MVGKRMRAKFRHRTTWRLEGDRSRQNKQTLKYLADALKSIWRMWEKWLR